jgi:hypothetical protein
MAASISMRDFARAVLPSGAADDGGLVMLAAYFDDSGTHKDSDIVLMAGAFGFPNQWDMFSEKWAKKLADPSPGKPPLSRFHMTECQAATGEFAGWSRTETDFLVHELGTIILACGIYGFGGAMSRKSYDQLVVGDRRRVAARSSGVPFLDRRRRRVATRRRALPSSGNFTISPNRSSVSDMGGSCGLAYQGRRRRRAGSRELITCARDRPARF